MLSKQDIGYMFMNLPTMIAMKAMQMKLTFHLWWAKVNIETPMYEKMKFSDKKFNNSKMALVFMRLSVDKLL